MNEILLRESITSQCDYIVRKLVNNSTNEFILMQHGSVILDQWFFRFIIFSFLH